MPGLACWRFSGYVSVEDLAALGPQRLPRGSVFFCPEALLLCHCLASFVSLIVLFLLLRQLFGLRAMCSLFKYWTSFSWGPDVRLWLWGAFPEAHAQRDGSSEQHFVKRHAVELFLLVPASSAKTQRGSSRGRSGIVVCCWPPRGVLTRKPL